MQETPRDERPTLAEDVDALAERAVSRGDLRRANHLRAVAEHLRRKEARTRVIDVRPEALARNGTARAGLVRRLIARLRR